MEPIFRESGKLKGIEVLFFQDAELVKFRGSQNSFSAFGPLSVLYFREYSRFVLRLDGWLYPLMRRLNISSSSEKGNLNSRTYVLPAANGYSFRLTINKVDNSLAFDNFENILDSNSRFSIVGKDIPYRKLEPSPDDKLMRKALREKGPKEIISQTLKQAFKKIENKAASLKSGTKNLTSTKKMTDVKSIKTKNFQKDAKSKITDFLGDAENISKEFLQLRKDNINLSESKDFDELRKTSDSKAPCLYFFQEAIEEAIIKNKEIFGKSEPETEKPEERRGLMRNLREGVQNVRERVGGLISRERPLVAPEMERNEPKMGLSEGLTHYEG